MRLGYGPINHLTWRIGLAPAKVLLTFNLSGFDSSATGHLLAKINWSAATQCPSTLNVGAGFHNCGDSQELTESIFSDSAVTFGQSGNAVWSHCDQYAFIAIHLPELPTSALEGIAYDAYKEWLDVAESLGFPEPIRLWNYLPRINDGLGDNERYRRFCMGRELAFKQRQRVSQALPAATAIGNSGSGVLLFGLASNRGFRQIENPRQVSAFKYPRKYGPASPSFARAAWFEPARGNGMLLVSGTASVVGHESKHVGYCEKQSLESIRNIDEVVKLCSETALPAQDPSLLRVYIRNTADYDTVASVIESRWPAAPTHYIQGEICRADLLVEIEAVFHAATQ